MYLLTGSPLSIAGLPVLWSRYGNCSLRRDGKKGSQAQPDRTTGISFGGELDIPFRDYAKGFVTVDDLSRGVKSPACASIAEPRPKLDVSKHGKSLFHNKAAFGGFVV